MYIEMSIGANGENSKGGSVDKGVSGILEKVSYAIFSLLVCKFLPALVEALY